MTNVAMWGAGILIEVCRCRSLSLAVGVGTGGSGMHAARWSSVDPGFHEAVASLSTDLDWEVKLGVIRTLGATLAMTQPSAAHGGSAPGRLPTTPCWAAFFGLSGDVLLLQATDDCEHGMCTPFMPGGSGWGVGQHALSRVSLHVSLACPPRPPPLTPLPPLPPLAHGISASPARGPVSQAIVAPQPC